MPIKFISLFIVTVMSTFIVTGVGRYLSLRLNVLNAKNISHTGGIAIGLVFIAVGIFTGFLTWGLTIALILMLVFGILDDWRELSVSAKLILQIACASILVYSGIRTHIVFIGDFLNILITFIWIIGVTNAINHLDIQDGLAGGIGLIISGAFFVLAIMGNDIGSATVSLALLGSLAGFLPYNWPNAKVYLGNTGSHLLGFILALIALNISYATMDRKFALLAPLFILGFPILDTLFLITARVKKGKSALLKSNDHLVLRMLKAGFSKNKALFVMLSLVIVFAVCGVLIAKVTNLFSAILLMVLAFICFWVFKLMGRVNIDG
jgi:UDP-GlcNAc:undecaprenyl-phosphate GlcNAc-1-phosphate transferase